MRLAVRPETFPLAGVFTISRGSRTEAHVLTVTLDEGGAQGRGECVPYARYGESLDSVAAEIAGLPERLTRAGLQPLLPAGAARNAVDCALWDLEAKRTGTRVWQLAGLPAPGPEITAFTLSLAAPAAMRAAAARNAHRPLLKIKLGGEGDMARLEAVRAGAPRARIVVDANEGWTPDAYAALAPALVRLGVAMVEQPLPAGDDAALGLMPRPLPVCADESCHDRASLPALAGRYDMVNIKLDKTGGLTEALALRDEHRRRHREAGADHAADHDTEPGGVGSVAQGAEVVDLDGPLLLARDRDVALRYDHRGVHPPAPELWG